MADWAVAICTFLLAIIAIFQDKIRSWIWSPSLECEIKLATPDCHRTISRSEGHEFTSYYYRFKILNKGNVSAKNVEVLVFDILRKKGDKFNRIESFSPDNLKWSALFDIVNRPKRYCDYISPDTYKHCNLGHIYDPNYRHLFPGEDNPALPIEKGETIFCFDVHFMSNNLYYLVGPGEYKIKIKAGCNNAKTITQEYLLKLTGKWFEDEHRMLNEGLLIKKI